MNTGQSMEWYCCNITPYQRPWLAQQSQLIRLYQYKNIKNNPMLLILCLFGGNSESVLIWLYSTSFRGRWENPQLRKCWCILWHQLYVTINSTTQQRQSRNQLSFKIKQGRWSHRKTLCTRMVPLEQVIILTQALTYDKRINNTFITYIIGVRLWQLRPCLLFISQLSSKTAIANSLFVSR
jgi:hypothetical protein